MDKKQIKYSVTSGSLLGLIKRAAPTSIAPKSVFSEDEVLEMRTGAGG
jgi:hypothetical protein